MKSLVRLEEEVLKKLLAGKSQWLVNLRDQASAMGPRSRELTGTGFVTRFSVPDDVPRLLNRPTFRFGDVSAEINDLKYGAGFLLFVKDGAIASLEGYSYEEPWPKDIREFRVYYTDKDLRDEEALTRSLVYSSTQQS
jgi:hypothetical protein